VPRKSPLVAVVESVDFFILSDHFFRTQLVAITTSGFSPP